MPTLDWLNREDAFRLAARVATRVLRPHARAPAVVGDALAAHGNLLVQGDSLEALAALLPLLPRPGEVHLHRPAVQHQERVRALRRQPGALGLADDDAAEAATAARVFGREDIFGTPKPERLIERILHIASNPKDLVLDSFLGSGTTAAVAHKMGRRWIGIEMGDHALTHCLPRLKKVVEGEQGGISAAVNWQGGGGFSVLQLGALLFDADSDIYPEVRFADLAAFLWMRETGSALDALRATCWHAGPKTIYGEACRLGEARLAVEGIRFKQLPHAVPR